MELLKTIGQKDPHRKYETRKAARAVVFDEEGNIALIHVSRNNYYKLPGGGIDEGESIEDGLRRECLEEIGCDVEVGKPLGKIVEYRHYPDGRNLDQESFCYIAKVKGKKGKPRLEQGEIDAGFVTRWVTGDEAIQLLGGGDPNVYQGPFVVERDLALVRKALRVG